MTRRKFVQLFCSLLCLLAVFLPSTSYAAEPMYKISWTELNTLSSNLQRLKKINIDNENELKELQNLLSKQKFELSELRSATEQQEKLLQTANESLKQYAKEEARKRHRIKRQRGMAYILAGGLLLAYITK